MIEMIERIVREKIVDPPAIKEATIACGEIEILLTSRKFSEEELRLILQDTKLFKKLIRDHIEPFPNHPEIEISPNLIISIGNSQSRWRWK